MIKKALKKLAALSGLQINKLNVASSPAYQTAQALKTHHINVVFDVGANIGQFANELRLHGYQGKIISFEPLSDAHAKLTLAAKGDKNWIIHPRCAVGATAGEIEINVAGNSVSSSILPMLAAHENAAPQSKYTHKQKVPLTCLNDVFAKYVSDNDKVFLKIDTQGYEAAVLEGADKILSHCTGVLLELSLVPLYSGQILWQELIASLVKTNHHIYALQTGFINNETGQTLQIDGLFFSKLEA